MILKYNSKTRLAPSIPKATACSPVGVFLTKRYDVPYKGWDIAKAIGKLGNKSIVPNLMEMLPNEEIHPVTRSGIVIEAISKLGDKSTIKRLTEIRDSKQVHLEVRKEIAHLLQKWES